MNFPENRYAVPSVYPLLHSRKDSVPASATSDHSTVNTALMVQVPGSKSITNRAMLLALLADGTSHLQGALFSDDSRHFLQFVTDLGFPVSVDEEACTVTITGFGGQIPQKEASLYVGSAGTAACF